MSIRLAYIKIILHALKEFPNSSSGFGADIHLLLVACQNVKWPIIKLYYCWPTNEAVPTTQIS
jgi:hypothetical protein